MHQLAHAQVYLLLLKPAAINILWVKTARKRYRNVLAGSKVEPT